MVKSESVTVFAGLEPVKHAEIDVEVIRFPFTTDEDLKNGVVDVCNQSYEANGQPYLASVNPRLKKLNWACWRVTADVVGEELVEQAGYSQPVYGLPVAFFLAIIIWICGAIIGYLLAKFIIYYVRIRPMEEALQDVVKTLDDVITQKHEQLALGNITQEYADELDATLEQARIDAVDAGEDPQYAWWEFLPRIMELAKYIPWIVGTIAVMSVLATVRAFAPRSRER